MSILRTGCSTWITSRDEKLVIDYDPVVPDRPLEVHIYYDGTSEEMPVHQLVDQALLVVQNYRDLINPRSENLSEKKQGLWSKFFRFLCPHVR